MLKTKFIKHSGISNEILEKIYKIKQSAWPYDLESQEKWILQHIKQDDFHAILSENGEIKAYLNLINIKFKVDKEIINGIGIGNVVTLNRGLGHGKMIMKSANDYILKNNKVGLLFCKEKLLKFYSNLSWKEIPKQNLIFQKKMENINGMMFNYHSNFNTVEYKFDLF